jgi:ATP-binding cassette, subfamily B, bacterial
VLCLIGQTGVGHKPFKKDFIIWRWEARARRSRVAKAAKKGVPSRPMSIYRRALAYYRPFLGKSIAATALTLVLMPFNLLKPWPFSLLVAALTWYMGATQKPPVFLGHDLSVYPIGSVIVGLCIALVVIHVASGLLNLASVMIYVRVGLLGLLRLRTELYAYLHLLPLKFHDQRRSADSSFRVAYDSQSLQTFYSKATFIFQTAVTLTSTFVVMCLLDWQLSLLALLVVPLMIVTFRIFALKIRAGATEIAERESEVLQQVQEGLSSIRMVQAFGREEHEVLQFQTHAERSLEANVRLQATSMKAALIVSSITAVSTAAMYWLGAKHLLEGSLSLDNLVAIFGYVVILYQPIDALTQVGWDLEKAAAGARRCFEVLDREDDVPDAPNAKMLEQARGDIVFDHVAFGYDADRLILSDVNLRLEPGKTVAFVGGTGAGKSTMLSLVPRFYDPNAGRILLDGCNLREITKKSLRNQISIVLQDTLLFSTTVRENIAYGRSDATEEEIVEAAKRAQAHDFIMAMPDGYRSQVGERGGHLSVGQRQRIGIARAFLKNAPILILDEPTSALDPTTESAIMSTLEELMRGRTTLIITHRIATIHRVDKIIVLSNGTVAEEGTGPELLARDGVYAGLYRSANLEG